MVQVNELAGKAGDAQAYNQLVRWVTQKEEHSAKVQEMISSYFLCQRVKSSDEDYMDALVSHHAVMVAAMKCKQSVDVEVAGSLRAAIDAIAPRYTHHHDHEH